MSQQFFGLRRLALAAALFGFAASAHAVVEIQWWHSMTGKLGDQVNEIARKREIVFQANIDKEDLGIGFINRDGSGLFRIPTTR